MTLTPLRDDRVLGPLREHLAELGPLAEAAVAEWLLGLQEPPGWARRVVLGPWQWVVAESYSWCRFPLAMDEQDKHTGTARVYVWNAQGEWWRYDRVAGASVSYPTRELAMRAADGAARGSYVFDPALPPEEAPPAPVPVPAHEMERAPAREAPRRGSGRRAGEHSWWAVEELGHTKRSIYPVILSRCEDCRLWRVGGRRYFPADMRPEGVRLLWREDGAGAAKAGRCPGRREP